jgi:hypothetical protein
VHLFVVAAVTLYAAGSAVTAVIWSRFRRARARLTLAHTALCVVLQVGGCLGAQPARLFPQKRSCRA